MSAYISSSIEDTAKIAADWLRHLARERQKAADIAELEKGATVIGLSGHLGAGKTAFVKAVAKKLGIPEEVTSPTFVLMKIYGIPKGAALRGDVQTRGDGIDAFPWSHLVHIDAYRLEGRRELEALDYENIVSDAGNLVMIEWPENVGLSRGGSDQGGLDETLHFEVRDGKYHISVK